VFAHKCFASVSLVNSSSGVCSSKVVAMIHDQIGTVRKIFGQAIRVVPNGSAIRTTHNRFQDGSNGEYDSVILATGYRPNYQQFFGTMKSSYRQVFQTKRTPRFILEDYTFPLPELWDISKEAVAVADRILNQHAVALALERTDSLSIAS